MNISTKKERNSNIELLRILAIMGVVVLHYNNPRIGGGIAYAKEGSLNFYILYFLESLFVCGVNLFMIISGYFMCESKKRNIWKPIELIIQVILFSEVLYIGKVLAGNTVFSIKNFVAMLLPANYFVIFYCLVFILSPFINVMIEHLSMKFFRLLIIISFAVFSVYPTIIDVFGELRGSEYVGLSSIGAYGSQWGYTIVNFVLMYLIGAFIRKWNREIVNVSILKLIGGLLGCIAIIMAWARINDRIGFFSERSAWEYCNPFVILEAAIILCIFLRIDFGKNKVLNKLAEATFTVFLFHQVFIRHLKIEEFVTGNTALMILHIIVCPVIIYLVCFGVHWIYHLIMNPIFKALSERIKIPLLDIDS